MQFYGVFAGDGEKQFKVFAIGQRREQRRLRGGFAASLKFGGAADRDRRREQFGADMTGVENVSEIAGKPIAQIDHCVNIELVSEPARLLETRFEIEMPALQRAA